jgi:hypothetical protein
MSPVDLRGGRNPQIITNIAHVDFRFDSDERVNHQFVGCCVWDQQYNIDNVASKLASISLQGIVINNKNL